MTTPAYAIDTHTLFWYDVVELPHYHEIPEMHDRLLVIQTNRLGAVLVTRDRTIQASSRVRWVW